MLAGCNAVCTGISLALAAGVGREEGWGLRLTHPGGRHPPQLVLSPMAANPTAGSPTDLSLLTPGCYRIVDYQSGFVVHQAAAGIAVRAA